MRQPYRFVNGWTTTASPNSTSRIRRYGASLPGASATVLRCGRNDGASLPHVALAASVTDDLSVPTGVLANSLGECVTTSWGRWVSGLPGFLVGVNHANEGNRSHSDARDVSSDDSHAPSPAAPAWNPPFRRW